MLKASPILKSTDIKIPEEFEGKLEELIQTCRESLLTVGEAMIPRAFRIGYWAHRNHERASGEQYITHPLEVATIVACDIRSDDVREGEARTHDVVAGA